MSCRNYRSRAFLLTGLWLFSKNLAWTVAAIVIAAALIGLTHWSQGPYGIVTIALKSFVTGVFYFRRRRLLPLVLSHVLFDVQSRRGRRSHNSF